MNDTPCRNCNKRSAECHGSCKDYQAYVDRNNKAKEERMKQKRADQLLKSFRSDQVEKALRAKKNRRNFKRK